MSNLILIKLFVEINFSDTFLFMCLTNIVKLWIRETYTFQI